MITPITHVIARHKAVLHRQGLVHSADVVTLSTRTASMRPGLTKVRAAMRELPAPGVSAGTSPMENLFGHTLPTLSPVLTALGEERADAIIGQLCDYGREMMTTHGADAVRSHLDGLFDMLTGLAFQIGQEKEVGRIIRAYRSLIFEMAAQEACRPSFGRNVQWLSADDENLLSITMGPGTTDNDLFPLFGCRVRKLFLGGTGIGDPAMVYLAHNPHLIELDISSTHVGDDGMRTLGTLSGLEILKINQTGVTDAGLTNLHGLQKLTCVEFSGTPVTQGGVLLLKLELAAARMKPS